MLELDFTNTGYIYMVLIWLIAPAIGIYLAIKKKRNPFFWGVMCLLIPMALFAIGGMRAPGEQVPPMFRNTNVAEQPEEETDTSTKEAHASGTAKAQQPEGTLNGTPLSQK